MITLNSLPWSGMGLVQQIVYAPLVGIMFLFVVLHLLLTVVYLKGLVGWLADREQFKSVINKPKFNIGLFSPIASISMTANVLWGPLAFFVPSLSGILQGLMLPPLICFMVLLLVLLALEAKVLKVWMVEPVDPVELNFLAPGCVRLWPGEPYRHRYCFYLRRCRHCFSGGIRRLNADFF